MRTIVFIGGLVSSSPVRSTL